jgi:small subunit ribosomal protein S17
MSDETTETEETPEVTPETEAPEAAAPAEPEEILHPKERRKRSRSAHDGTARPARTAEERQAEREAKRAAKAVARRRRREQEREKFVAAREKSGPLPTTEPAEKVPGNPKVRQGVVTSSKADKTITVRVDTARRHRRYEKIVRSSSTLHAHDENNTAGEGDTVRVIECRPLSRTKRWRLVEVLERAK